MTTSIGFLLAGLGGGAVVALLALGLVLTHRSSGFVNFAHAATGTYVALAFFEFRSTGAVVLPVLGLPARVQLLDRPTLATSLLMATVLSAAVGALVYALVVRPLRSSPPLSRVVASLGLMLYVQEMTRVRFPVSGSAVAPRQPVLSTVPLDLAGVAVTADRVLLAVLAIMLTIALVVVFRTTRFGLATRAAAERPRGALLLGLSPDSVGLGCWSLSTALAGLAIILVEPIAGISPTTTPLLVVPALAAALPGRLDSFGAATATALALGMAQSLVLGWSVDPALAWVPDWLPTTGIQQAIPLLVIVVVLALRSDAVPDRASRFDTALARSPRPRHVAATLALGSTAAIGLLLVGDAAIRQGLIVSSIAAVLSLSVVVVTGYSGQISLAPLALAGVAGFASLHLVDRGVPFLVALVVAAALATAVGVAAAWPASRVRGMGLAVATLAVAVAIEQLVLASSAVSGGLAGSRVPRPTVLGLDLGISAPGDGNFRAEFGLLCVAVLALCATAVANLRRGPTGLRWLAVRANERAATATGIDIARAKLTAFGVSSFIAGLAGVLTAFSVSTLSPTSFVVLGSLVTVALTYLCGIASIGGAVLAGLLAQGGLLVALGGNGGATGGTGAGTSLAWSGVALVAATILAPSGITGLLGDARARRAR